jgi:formylglycine-generating enzyme required for sulfatase activity
MRSLEPLALVLGIATCAIPLAVSAKNGVSPSRPHGDLPPWSAPATDGVLTLRSPEWPMAEIVGGTFEMGSSPDEILDALIQCQREPMGHRCETDMFGNEQPRRTIRLSPYWMDRHEVTYADYARCVAAGRCRPAGFTPGARRFTRPNHPVSLVTHRDAQAYCAYRGTRLPTEAEWERAARGLAQRPFPWGYLYNDRMANHGRFAWSRTDATDGYAELAPVGSFPEGATPDGIFDLAGNVAEWVHDRYLPTYLDGDLLDPQGPSAPPAGRERVVRGGGYQDAAVWLRAAARRSADPDIRRPDIGFRCARNAVRSAD